MTKLCFHCLKKAKYERQVIILSNSNLINYDYDINNMINVFECKEHFNKSIEYKRKKE